MEKNENLNGGNVAVDLEAERKAKKAEASKRWAENKAKERDERIKNAQKLAEHLKKNNVWDKLTPELQQYVVELGTPSTANTNNGVFQQIFGVSPKVGDKVTFLQVVEKTCKGLAPMLKYIKTWAERGIVVEYTANPAKPLEGLFTIKALPTV